MHCVRCNYIYTRVQGTHRKYGQSFRIRSCESCGYKFRTKEVYDKEVKAVKTKIDKPSELNENTLHYNFEKGN